MNDPREDLADLIYPMPQDRRSIGAAHFRQRALQCADAVIAAGWRPPARTHPEHEVDMERFPACTVCGQDVVWNDKFQRWEH